MYTLHSPLCYTMLLLPDGPVSPPGRRGVLPALPPAGELPLPPPHPPPRPQEPAGPEGGHRPTPPRGAGRCGWTPPWAWGGLVAYTDWL